MSHTIRCFQDLLPEQGIFYPLSNDISKFWDSEIVFEILYVDLTLIFFWNDNFSQMVRFILNTFFAAIMAMIIMRPKYAIYNSVCWG